MTLRGREQREEVSAAVRRQGELTKVGSSGQRGPVGVVPVPSFLQGTGSCHSPGRGHLSSSYHANDWAGTAEGGWNLVPDIHGEGAG